MIIYRTDLIYYPSQTPSSDSLDGMNDLYDRLVKENACEHYFTTLGEYIASFGQPCIQKPVSHNRVSRINSEIDIAWKEPSHRFFVLHYRSSIAADAAADADCLFKSICQPVKIDLCYIEHNRLDMQRIKSSHSDWFGWYNYMIKRLSYPLETARCCLTPYVNINNSSAEFIPCSQNRSSKILAITYLSRNSLSGSLLRKLYSRDETIAHIPTFIHFKHMTIENNLANINDIDDPLWHALKENPSTPLEILQEQLEHFTRILEYKDKDHVYSAEYHDNVHKTIRGLM
jgi:hypothetical protein